MRSKLLAAVLTLTLVFGLALMAMTDAFAQGQGRGKPGPGEIEVLKFVHYVGPGSGPNSPPIFNDQYRTMHGGKVKWYVDMPISATIDDGFTAEETARIEESLTTWDDVSGWDVDIGIGDYWGSDFDDAVNAISWNKDDLDANVIGVTWIWYYPDTGEIVEVGVELNEDDFDWSTTGEPGKMDVQNIMTHEVGHWMVLEDLRQPTAREITMYAYSNYGETIKRELQSGDVAGAQALYGVAAPPLIPAKKLSTTWGEIKGK